MIIHKRDVVEVFFDSNTGGVHPAIVLSPEEVNSEEGRVVVMMLSSSPYIDRDNDYSFPLDDSMFIRPLKPGTKARLYMIGSFDFSFIVPGGKKNEMKPEAFKRLIANLNTKVFGV